MIDEMTDMQTLVYCAKNGIKVCLVGDNVFTLDGFYKSDIVYVDLNDNTVCSRYDRVIPIEEYSNLLMALIEENNYWYHHSKICSDAWADRHPSWKKISDEFYMDKN